MPYVGLDMARMRPGCELVDKKANSFLAWNQISLLPQGKRGRKGGKEPREGASVNLKW
jgi:hypothetical protein